MNIRRWALDLTHFPIENNVHVWYGAGHKGSRRSAKRAINLVGMAREAHEGGGARLGPAGRWDEECEKEKQEHPVGQAREEASRGQNSFMEGGIGLVYTECPRWASGTKVDGARH